MSKSVIHLETNKQVGADERIEISTSEKHTFIYFLQLKKDVTLILHMVYLNVKKRLTSAHILFSEDLVQNFWV